MRGVKRWGSLAVVAAMAAGGMWMRGRDVGREAIALPAQPAAAPAIEMARPVSQSKGDRVISVQTSSIKTAVPSGASAIPVALSPRPMPTKPAVLLPTDGDIVGSIPAPPLAAPANLADTEPGVSVMPTTLASLTPTVPASPTAATAPATPTAATTPQFSAPLPLAAPQPAARTVQSAPMPQPRPVTLASLVPMVPSAPASAITTPANPEAAAPSPALSPRVGSTAPLGQRLAAKGFSLGDPVFIRIFKEESKLEVWMGKGGSYSLFESFAICKWSGQLGPKQAQGDYQSPEGFYAVSRRQLNPNSAYHLAFNLGFPNAYDRANGRHGAALMVHGNCKSVGCFAMTDRGIEQIYALVEAALAKQAEVPVHIFPFRMTQSSMFRSLLHPWGGFWRNLAEGYNAFETTKRVPAVGVCGGQYVFGDKAAGCTRIAGW